MPVLVQPPLAVHCNARLSQSLQQQEPSSTVSERDGEPLLLEALGRTTSSRRRSLVLALCCQLFSHLSLERSSCYERKRSTNELHNVTHGPPPPHLLAPGLPVLLLTVLHPPSAWNFCGLYTSSKPFSSAPMSWFLRASAGISPCSGSREA